MLLVYRSPSPEFKHRTIPLLDHISNYLSFVWYFEYVLIIESKMSIHVDTCQALCSILWLYLNVFSFPCYYLIRISDRCININSRNRGFWVIVFAHFIAMLFSWLFLLKYQINHKEYKCVVYVLLKTSLSTLGIDL